MKNKFKFLALAIMALLSSNVWGADVTIASWGAVSLAANTDVNASSYQGTTAPKMRSNKAITSSATYAYYGGSAGGATITISGLPSGYKTKSVTFYSRASKGGNFAVSYSTNGGTSYTSAGTSSTLGTSGTPKSYTVTFSSAVSDVTNIKFVHSGASGSLYFGTVSVTGEAEAGGGGGGGGGGETSATYVKATSISDLCVGAKVIIAASGYDFAMSETQNSNNRGQAGITKNGNNATWTTAATDVEEFTLGKTGDYYTFKDKSNRYIYAASSSSNYLKSQATNDANGEWTISISDGVATIQSHGANTRKVMQYNQSSSLFACYASASQKALAIYVKDGDCSSCTAISPTLSYTAATTIGQVLNPTLDKKGSTGAVTYSIKTGGTYATINTTTGALTCNAAGTVTVQATIAAAGDYCEGTATSNTITISAAAYSISYNLDGGTHGTNHPTSGTIGTAFAVSPPTKTHYTFTGWQVTSGLNTSTAKWGPTLGLLQHSITSSTQKYIVSTTSDIYFTDLGANGASVTLTATWEEKAKVTVTLLNNNVPVNAGGFDAQGQKQYYSDETLGALPTLTSGVACDATSTTFMGWTTEQITTKRDYAPDFVTPSTPVTPNMTLRAVWAKEE